ncbi:Gfo/Idh/MocA family protein [Lacticaseibacillus yichunensis]|uniref:Gfo/Idh/MocA family protein n=1 Tax=Lacticaseibacillus yichunensis TaxID=2486015 RepID=A0ABW4CN11_9LACO|nr:Gfo/Idh/MocA family oxidoreductase [Lacticaseibacillus yichunensis]
MLNIGVIGLGNIAQKAYLPVYAQMQDKVQFYLMTRDLAKLTALANQYHMVAAGTEVAALDGLNLDAVMIHAATPAHYELAEHFLSRGVNVFIDKPLATSMAQVTALYLLAAQHQKLLTVGFNRRFAPLDKQLIALPDKNMISVVKNRVNAPQPVAEAIYDLLIHPLDTALALANFPEEPNARFSLHKNKDGLLEQASITFTGNGVHGEAAINLVAGANLEEATVATPTGVYRVQNLSQLQHFAGSNVTTEVAPDWEPTLETRGFAPLIHAFVEAVANSTANPIEPQTSRLTHSLLDEMLHRLAD